MGGGNGAKAAQKRERNLKAAASKAGGTSQLKSNQASMNIQCKTCFSTFANTSKAPALKEHALNKHSKGLEECFPGFKE